MTIAFLSIAGFFMVAAIAIIKTLWGIETLLASIATAQWLNKAQPVLPPIDNPRINGIEPVGREPYA